MQLIITKQQLFFVTNIVYRLFVLSITHNFIFYIGGYLECGTKYHDQPNVSVFSSDFIKEYMLNKQTTTDTV